MEEHPHLLALLNARFYARCAELWVVPPVGKAGPPPVPEALLSAHDRAVGRAQEDFATGQTGTEEYQDALQSAANTLARSLARSGCQSSPWVASDLTTDSPPILT